VRAQLTSMRRYQVLERDLVARPGTRKQVF